MPDVINTVLIDDESDSIAILEKMLAKHCDNVSVIGTANSVEEGVKTINELKPDLIFLDISMPDGDGFDVLDQTKDKNFEVIFITAFNDYALKAFEFSALHYLLKPISKQDLTDAVARYKSIKEDELFSDKVKVLNDNLTGKQHRIILPEADGFSIIELDDIIYCESFNSYTTFYTKNGKQAIVAKSINNYEEILSDLQFVRIHRSYIINIQYLKKYVKGRGGYVILEDGTNIDVSEGKKRDFMNKLSEYARRL